MVQLEGFTPAVGQYYFGGNIRCGEMPEHILPVGGITVARRHSSCPACCLDAVHTVDEGLAGRGRKPLPPMQFERSNSEQLLIGIDRSGCRVMIDSDTE